MVGLALATRTRMNADEGDLQALQGIEQRLVKELERLDKIRKAADAIVRQAKIIEDEVGKGEKKVSKLVDDSRKTLLALNVELRDEEVERGTPIGMNALTAENDLTAAIPSCL